jgi:hypothetical protein
MMECPLIRNLLAGALGFSSNNQAIEPKYRLALPPMPLDESVESFTRNMPTLT